MKSEQAVNFKMLESLFSEMSLDDKVDEINHIREFLHEHSPFKAEPVDYVKWVKNTNVVSNDYNPNKVAPTEMKLLELSIMNDGYTQPIVSWSNEDKGATEVIDGFHRNRVGRESKAVNQRVQGYLPVVDIRTEQSGKNDRMASTIRHNRARGKHQIDAMSEIVIELKIETGEMPVLLVSLEWMKKRFYAYVRFQGLNIYSLIKTFLDHGRQLIPWMLGSL